MLLSQTSDIIGFWNWYVDPRSRQKDKFMRRRSVFNLAVYYEDIKMVRKYVTAKPSLSSIHCHFIQKALTH